MSFRGITHLHRAPAHPAVVVPPPPVPGRGSFGIIITGLTEPPTDTAVMGRKTPARAGASKGAGRKQHERANATETLMVFHIMTSMDPTLIK